MADRSLIGLPPVDRQSSTLARESRRHRSVVAYRQILVPVTDSAASERVLVIAAQLASEKKAEVTVLNVIEVPRDLPLDALFPDEEHEGREILRRATAILDSYGVHSKTRLTRSFSRATAILEAARDTHPEIIVIGAERHARTQARVFRDAETIQEVLKAAPCRVMLVSPQPTKTGS
jgi:nucleotide-binding universal stress UspA family protein